MRAIGVSNFLPQHLLNLMEHAEVVPAVDQLEFHPGHTQEVTLRFCQDHGIQVQAWSPLGRNRVLKDPLIVSLAEKYGVSPAQLCLKYDLQRGVMVIPKASSPERMRPISRSRRSICIVSIQCRTMDGRGNIRSGNALISRSRHMKGEWAHEAQPA